MDIFSKIVDLFKKSSILDICKGSEYVSAKILLINNTTAVGSLRLHLTVSRRVFQLVFLSHFFHTPLRSINQIKLELWKKNLFVCRISVKSLNQISFFYVFKKIIKSSFQLTNFFCFKQNQTIFLKQKTTAGKQSFFHLFAIAGKNFQLNSSPNNILKIPES